MSSAYEIFNPFVGGIYSISEEICGSILYQPYPIFFLHVADLSFLFLSPDIVMVDYCVLSTHFALSFIIKIYILVVIILLTYDWKHMEHTRIYETFICQVYIWKTHNNMCYDILYIFKTF